MGAAGMTYEKGTAKSTAAGLRPLPGDRHDDQRHREQQVQDHSPTGSAQWGEAIQQGEQLPAAGEHARQPAAPSTIEQQPAGPTSAATSSCRTAHRRHGALIGAAAAPAYACTGSTRRWRVNGYHEYGKPDSTARRCRRGPSGSRSTRAQALDPGAPRGEPVASGQLLLRRRHLVLPATPRPGRHRLPHGADVARHRDDRDQRTRNSVRLPGTAPRCYAFNTDSMRGLGLAIDLLSRASTSTARRPRSTRADALLHRRGAGRRRVAGRQGRPGGARGCTATPRCSGWRTTRCALPARTPEDRALHGLGHVPSVSVQPAGHEDGHCGLSGSATSFCQAHVHARGQGRVPAGS